MFLIILKLKKQRKHVVKKLPYLLRYILDQYKAQKMWDKAISENGETLKALLNCYKNQEMCFKEVDNYDYALKFVSECYNMSDKAVDKHLSTI